MEQVYLKQPIILLLGGENTTKFEALNEGTPIKLTSIDITYGAADPNAVAAPTFDAVTPL